MSKDFMKILRTVIIGFFIFCAILTVGVSIAGALEDDDEGETSNTESVEGRRDDVLKDLKANSDNDGNTKPSAQDEQDAMEELNNLIGLESVKKEVESLANFIRVQKAREAQGMKSPDISYHLVFSGNPGTGKTTVARILARIYRDLGVIKKGHLVETDRSGLIGQYVGQTAPLVNQMCDSAMGGVLFIDEAYAITQKTGSSGGSDYGDEAVATLLKRMEDNRDNLIVIVAGYTNEMKQFIETNPGLKSRFTRYIEFPDYSPDDLCKIYMQRINKYGFTMTDDAMECLKEGMDEAVATKDRNFGNGRYARNLFENTVTAQSDRLGKGDVSKMTEKKLNVIERSDVNKAFANTKK